MLRTVYFNIATGGSIGSASGPPPAPSATAAAAANSGGDLSLNLRGGSRGTSAPSSPAKSRESLLQRVQSLTGAARDQGANLLGNVCLQPFPRDPLLHSTAPKFGLYLHKIWLGKWGTEL